MLIKFVQERSWIDDSELEFNSDRLALKELHRSLLYPGLRPMSAPPSSIPSNSSAPPSPSPTATNSASANVGGGEQRSWTRSLARLIKNLRSR